MRSAVDFNLRTVYLRSRDEMGWGVGKELGKTSTR